MRCGLERFGPRSLTRWPDLRQTAKGRNKTQILRLRKTCHHPRDVQTTHPGLRFDDCSDLRPAHHAKDITVTAAAKHIGVGSITISRLERGRHRNHTLATQLQTVSYHHTLTPHNNGRIAGERSARVIIDPHGASKRWTNTP